MSQEEKNTRDKGKFIAVVLSSAIALCLSAVSLMLFGLDTAVTGFVKLTVFLTGLSIVTAFTLAIIFRNSIRKTASEFAMSDFAAALKKIPVFNKFLSDYKYRVLFFAFITSISNLGFIIYLLVMAITHLSAWYASLLGMYTALYALRSAIIISDRLHVEKRGIKAQWIIFLVTGACLPAVAGIMAAPIIQMTIGSYPKGGGIFNIVVNSIFAITKISVAISGIAKSRNRKEPVIFALKNINTVVAFISLFNLQISIIIPFAHGYTMWEVVTALGALIAGWTLLLGVYMVILASIKLRRMHEAAVEAKAATGENFTISKTRLLIDNDDEDDEDYEDCDESSNECDETEECGETYGTDDAVRNEPSADD